MGKISLASFIVKIDLHQRNIIERDSSTILRRIIEKIELSTLLR